MERAKTRGRREHSVPPAHSACVIRCLRPFAVTPLGTCCSVQPSWAYLSAGSGCANELRNQMSRCAVCAGW